MTRGQSNNKWSGGIAAHPAPQNFKCKSPLVKFSPRFFWDKVGILLIDYFCKGSNYQCGVLLISAGATEGHFEGKTPREGHQGRLVLGMTMTRLAAYLQPRRNWPTWASNILITHPCSPDLAPSDYHLFSGLKKNN